MIQAREENRAPEESRAPGESRATALNLSAAAGDYGQRWQQAAGDLPRPRHLSPAAYSLGGKFLNRELSWLEFNRRVLQEARNRNNPFMERLNFLSITQSNLDEFYMVRVASLKDQVSAGYDKADLAGLLPQQQLTAISEQAHSMLSKMFSTYNRSLEPALRKNGIYILQPEELSPAQAEEVLLYFRETVYPILTPMAVDSARPFPLIYNRSLNLCFLLQNENQESNFVTVQVPSVIPRCHRIQAQPAKELAEAARAAGREAVCYILLEDIIRWQIDSLCRGQEIQAIACYRIMRNADMDIDEEEAADLLTEIEKQIRLRDWGAVIHLETATGIDSRLLSFLVDSLKVDRQDIYLINGPLDLTFLSQLYQQPPIRALTALYYPPYEGQASDMLEGNRRALADDGQTDPDIFALIARQDILLHHPYEAFDPVLNFLKQAAEDPDVLAIKMTLYRVSGHSRIIDYLERAAQNS
ncbi:MAG: RNA degradosome polyphosphate kinase, partial [Oscillospiraceae bacterium]|nr:RNA degradosome polyphosphate kinase [Oscillospiraceae bacterium]